MIIFLPYFRHAFFLVFVLFRALPVEAGPVEDAIRDKCKRHLEAVASRQQSRCGLPEVATLFTDLNNLATAAKPVCEEAVTKLVENRAEYDRLLREGTSEAARVRAELGDGRIAVDSQTQALVAQRQVVSTVADSLRTRNTQILSSIRSYGEALRKVREKEAAYDAYRGRLRPGSYPSGGGTCSSSEGELGTLRLVSWRLDSEMAELRSGLAENVQALNSLYQRNLTTLGASQEQAVALARQNTDAASIGSIGANGAPEDANRSVWDRLFGAPSPHQREVGQVECATGGSGGGGQEGGGAIAGQGCYGFVPVNRNSNVDDAVLARIGGSGQLEAGRAPAAVAEQAGAVGAGAGAGAAAAVLGGENDSAYFSRSMAAAANPARADAFREAIRASGGTVPPGATGAVDHNALNEYQALMNNPASAARLRQNLQSRGF